MLLNSYHVKAEQLLHKDFPIDDLRHELGLSSLPFETILDLIGDGGDLAEGIVLRVEISQYGRDLMLRLRYRTEVLDAGCASRIGSYHLTALALMVADPGTDHEQQSLLSAEELRFQIEVLAGHHRELPDFRVHELFEQQMEAHPNVIVRASGSILAAITADPLGQRCGREKL